MNDTPETDNERTLKLALEVFTELANTLKRERDEALEKIKQQKLEIVRLNGATNHAGGTPLKIALRERDEAREALMKIEDLFIDGSIQSKLMGQIFAHTNKSWA
jgi:hypothetical protein